MEATSRPTRLVLALTVLMIFPALAPATSVGADAGCALFEQGQLPAGLAGERVDGVSATDVPVPLACGGEPFALTGSNPGDDWDVCFYGGGVEIDCSDAPGNEQGTIPDGADEARITYWAGAGGTFTLEAPFGLVGENAATGPATLYLRSGPTGVGNADGAQGPGLLDEEAPTKTTPSAWSSAYDYLAGQPDPVNPKWTWAPEDGFDLVNANVDVTFWFTTADDSRTRYARWDVALLVDGVTVVRTPQDSVEVTMAPTDGVLQVTANLGDLTLSGLELAVEISPDYLNVGGVNTILYDAVDYPSRVDIGASVIDTTAPTAPTTVSASAQSDSSITVAWDGATDDIGVDHYNLYRGAAPETLALLTSTSGTSYRDTGLDAATTYFYAVSAVDAAGNEGAPSDAVGATTLELGAGPDMDRPFTVVALIDSGYNPYHFDFVGHQHPWNTDADPNNDIDLTVDPATYIEGYPGATPVPITIPTDPNADVGDLRAADADAWASFAASSGSGDGFRLHWIPGTKIIGAAHYGNGFYSSNSAHGTRSAASAAGNIHGSCPECLFVLVAGLGNNGVTWAAQQPWIDVVSNSWESCFVSCATRNGIQTGTPVQQWKQASNDGQTIVFAAGNGQANAFVAPQFGYPNSQKGTDWVVKVGAVNPSSKQSYSGSTKPVDISSIGSSYPSTGGSTATGTGTHSGTSNAAPVVAGYIAQVLQDVREVLDDTSSGYAGGVVASGAPVACGAALPDCPLGDGELTRPELRDLVFHNVLPDTGVSCCSTTWPNSEYNYFYQGHGVAFGLIDGPEPYQAQIDQMVANAVGDADNLERPPGETNWFIVDSKCRQALWGSWDHGYYQGVDPVLDPVADPLATAFNTWCSQL